MYESNMEMLSNLTIFRTSPHVNTVGSGCSRKLYSDGEWPFCPYLVLLFLSSYFCEYKPPQFDFVIVHLQHAYYVGKPGICVECISYMIGARWHICLIGWKNGNLITSVVRFDIYVDHLWTVKYLNIFYNYDARWL